MSNNVTQRMSGSEGLRILAVGDCNTCGTGRPTPDNCVPAQLARRLQASGQACSVQNLGYRMSTTREGLVRMQRDAEPADVVLVNFGLVDAWITSIPRIYIPYYPDNFVRKQLRKLLKSTKRRLRSPLARRFVPSGTVVPEAEYTANLERIISIAQQWDGATILLWGTAPSLEAHRAPSIHEYNAQMHALAQRMDIPYIDTTSLIEGLSAEDTYQDDTHLAGPAVDRIAERMAGVISEIRGRRCDRRAA